MPRGCSRCGFAFLFELLDDYYPAPDAAFFVCDQEGRLIGLGRGSRELTGLTEERVMGRPVGDVLGLVGRGGRDVAALMGGGRVIVHHSVITRMVLGAGGYASVAERFFANTDVNHFLLEYDTPRAGDFAPLRFVPAPTRRISSMRSRSRRRPSSRRTERARAEGPVATGCQRGAGQTPQSEELSFLDLMAARDQRRQRYDQ